MISNYLKCGFFGKNTQRPVVDKENPADALQSLQKNKLTAEISEDRASVGYDNGKNEVLAVIVHRTDRIKSKLYITHPTIKIHLLNVQTGQYVKKSRSNKPGSYFTENRSIDYLLPQMTKPSIITHQNTIPCWEELIVFNEYVSYLTSMNDDVVILFELLDFVNMKRLTSRRKITLLDEGNDSDSGWVRIAWAFLKIFMWYRCNVRSKYRGSLFVTVKPTVCLSSISTALRSMYPSQAEKRASLTSKETSNFKEELETSHKLENQVVWAKLTGEICKVPNKKVENLYPGKNGCLSIVFSKNGRFIACGGMECPQRHVIYLFSVPEYQYIGAYYGHIDIIYCLNFDYISSRLISCSSDNTVRLWDVELFACLQIFPHPSFVYTVLVLDDATFLSGCYDGVIRLYNYSESKPTPEKELVGHEAGVNCLYLSPDRKTLFSGDFRGKIMTWIKANDDRNWQFKGKLSINEVSEKSIDTLMLSTDGRRLFVYCRDKIIYVVDTRSWTVRRRLASKSIVAPNRREFSTISRCCMTPCGTFIFAPALNGSAMNVWRTRDMELIAEYKDLCTTSDIEEGDTAPSYVAIAAYHPLDHIVAFGVYGEEQNVLIYRFDTAAKSICRINSFTGDRESNEKDSKMPDFSMGRFLARQKGRAMES